MDDGRRREAPDPGPPHGEPAASDPEGAPLPGSVSCPFCSGRDTELFAAFGSLASAAQYYCRRCRTVFEYLKWGPPG
ncbi:MAG: hypothetical protein ACREKI_09985 [Gemmatimonadota bacterium]